MDHTEWPISVSHCCHSVKISTQLSKNPCVLCLHSHFIPTLSPCAVDSLSPSDCLHQPSPLFPFCCHISLFRQLHSSYFMYLIYPFSPWSSSTPASISVCQHHS